MIICDKPILSFDVPQNRNTLNNFGGYFKNFDDLYKILNSTKIFKYLIPVDVMKKYNWTNVIKSYENLF